MKNILFILLLFFCTVSYSQVHITQGTGSGLIPQSKVAGLIDSITDLRASFNSGIGGNAGTATALQTARFIYGNSFNGTSDLNQIIASGFGGTGNGFTKFTGASGTEKTYTLPNVNSIILTDNAAVTVAQGGTGLTTITADSYLKGNGTGNLVPRTYAQVKTDLSLDLVTNMSFATMNSTTAVLLGKTISGSSNTFSNIPVSALSATGTPSVSTFLRGDNSWATISSGNLTNGNKGSITVSGILNDSWTINNLAVTNSMLAGSIDLTSKVTGLLLGTNGGTGVNNSGRTITLANNLATSGNFALTLTTTATTNVTLPTTGTLATRAGTETFTNKTLNYASNSILNLPVSLIVAASDEVTTITTGVAKVTFRMPHAVTLTAVRASLTSASTSGVVTVDILENGVSILSVKLTIDANEKTSVTAATQPVISDVNLANDAEITVSVLGAGANATGLKISLIGTR